MPNAVLFEILAKHLCPERRIGVPLERDVEKAADERAAASSSSTEAASRAIGEWGTRRNLSEWFSTLPSGCQRTSSS
jgi:hypothetical protein